MTGAEGADAADSGGDVLGDASGWKINSCALGLNLVIFQKEATTKNVPAATWSPTDAAIVVRKKRPDPSFTPMAVVNMEWQRTAA